MTKIHKRICLQDSGVTININSFREDYSERLNRGDYYLSGGSSNDCKTVDKTIKEKAIQTMDLKRNRSKYIKEKNTKNSSRFFCSITIMYIIYISGRAYTRVSIRIV